MFGDLDHVVHCGALKLDREGHGFVLSQLCLFGHLCVILLPSTATVPNRIVEDAENVSISICEKVPGTQIKQTNKLTN